MGLSKQCIGEGSIGEAEQNNVLVKEDEYTLKADMLTARGDRRVRRHSS